MRGGRAFGGHPHRVFLQALGAWFFITESGKRRLFSSVVQFPPFFFLVGIPRLGRRQSNIPTAGIAEGGGGEFWSEYCFLSFDGQMGPVAIRSLFEGGGC